ncbi:unnamed protein product [Parnassius apollo]|uniref:(apollo) hypothetical protein n=1 Tax=Parnassius apollo TaxID=110799 RepID=A0A8S3XZ86_PARAO|nr:unnamed protein product [Parnassius apollo]
MRCTYHFYFLADKFSPRETQNSMSIDTSSPSAAKTQQIQNHRLLMKNYSKKMNRSLKLLLPSDHLCPAMVNNRRSPKLQDQIKEK